MRRLFPLLGLVLALPLASCDSTTPEGAIAGTYQLQTINGNHLPWTAFQVEADHLDVMSGAIVLEPDGTFTDRTSYQITENGASRMEEDLYTGTYALSVNGATLSPVGFEPYEVEIRGERMSQIIGDFELVYQK